MDALRQIAHDLPADPGAERIADVEGVFDEVRVQHGLDVRRKRADRVGVGIMGLVALAVAAQVDAEDAVPGIRESACPSGQHPGVSRARREAVHEHDHRGVDIAPAVSRQTRAVGGIDELRIRHPRQIGERNSHPSIMTPPPWIGACWTRFHNIILPTDANVGCPAYL